MTHFWHGHDSVEHYLAWRRFSQSPHRMTPPSSADPRADALRETILQLYVIGEESAPRIAQRLHIPQSRINAILTEAFGGEQDR